MPKQIYKRIEVVAYYEGKATVKQLKAIVAKALADIEGLEPGETNIVDVEFNKVTREEVVQAEDVTPHAK